MRSRRALSTVVGAVFAIIALTSTVTYVSYSMGILDNYNQSVLTKNQQLSDVNKEKFQISSVTVPNNKLNITVVNMGGVPINFTKIWVQNTTATDWVKSYTPTNNFVVPGGTLKNIGQNIPTSINAAYSYSVKLVTSRGNTQQLTLNSASAAPLNIQFFTVPSSVNVGYTTKLMMLVTNNGSSTITNIIPTTPTISGTAVCTLSQASPSTYNTLAPGNTAVFTWTVSIVSGVNNQYCDFTSTPPIQNGYSGQTVTARVTVNLITFSQTLLAQNTGILTLNYTTFRWTQSSGTSTGDWFTGWSMPGAPNTVFRFNVTNNNATSDLYISYNSVMVIRGVGSSNILAFYIINSTTPGSPFTITPYTCSNPNDYCLKVPAGKTGVLYFGANRAQAGSTSPTQSSLSGATQYYTNLLLYGKFSTSKTNPGSTYAQSLPYIAIVGTQ